jgi:hypothetical protein
MNSFGIAPVTYLEVGLLSRDEEPWEKMMTKITECNRPNNEFTNLNRDNVNMEVVSPILFEVETSIDRICGKWGDAFAEMKRLGD